ncbi:calcium-binding protein [Streptomyces sp. NPDC005708]|uniref:calcium-binding protein n=1 Tax=Streptomyces sp. NPDC005708 TaxID=3154564 RepID=UPI0033C7BFD0
MTQGGAAGSWPREDGQLSDAELDELVAQATVDAYDDEEQLTGLYTLLAEHLAIPFKTVVLGVEVTVKKVDLLPGSQIVAVCTRGRHQQAIGILDLPLPDPAPEGAEWIEAYRHWGP